MFIVLNVYVCYELIVEVFGGKGYYVSILIELELVLIDVLVLNGLLFIDCEFDFVDGVESGYLVKLNIISVVMFVISGDG